MERTSLYFLPIQQQNVQDIWNLVRLPDQNVFIVSNYSFWN